MNISTTHCINTNAEGKGYLTLPQVAFLITFDIIILIANCFANFLVMLILTKTNQLSNYSMKFISLLSFTDFFTGVSVQIFYIPVNVLPLQYPCSINLISQFLGATFTRISAYIVGLIGIGRYFGVKLKTNFRGIITTLQAYIMKIGACILAVVNGSILTIGPIINKTDLSRFVVVSTDVIIFVLVIALQIKTISIMKRLTDDACNPEILRAMSNTIIKLASRVITLLIVFVLPFVVVTSVYGQFGKKLQGTSKSYIELVFRLSFMGIYLNGFSNAVFFLSTNVQAKAYLRLKLRELRRFNVEKHNENSQCDNKENR